MIPVTSACHLGVFFFLEMMSQTSDGFMRILLSAAFVSVVGYKMWILHMSQVWSWNRTSEQSTQTSLL